ncbi:MAG: hypothetical protein AAGD33_12245 [Actinomycetota bacterium]
MTTTVQHEQRGTGTTNQGRTARSIAAIGTGLLLLAACSSGETETPDEPAADESATSDTAPTEPADTAPPTSAPPTTEPAPEPEPVGGAVTFDIDVDLMSQIPTGRFVVSEGADVLGCDDGRFFMASDRELFTMTCENGERSGEFRMAFATVVAEDDSITGTWVIESATGDFETLTGEGDLVGVRDMTTRTITETRTGEIRYAVTEPAGIVARSFPTPPYTPWDEI